LKKAQSLIFIFVLTIGILVTLSWKGNTEEADIFIQAQKARQQGDTELAYRLFEQAAKNNIRAHDAYYEMGLILLEKEKWMQAYRISGKAVEAFMGYLEENPHDGNAWFRLAYIYENRSFAPGVNEWSEAIAALENALAILPGDPQCLLHLGYVYYKIKRKDEAEKVLLGLVEKYPDYIDARYYLAMNYLERQDKAKARLHFSYIVENAPQGNSYTQWAKKELLKLEGGPQ